MFVPVRRLYASCCRHILSYRTLHNGHITAVPRKMLRGIKPSIAKQNAEDSILFSFRALSLSPEEAKINSYILPNCLPTSTIDYSLPETNVQKIIKYIGLPSDVVHEKLDPLPDSEKVAPAKDSSIKIHAARLIKIRRSKMNKHKLKKLRRRMKFVWAKARQKKEWKKEVRFQNELMSQIEEAEKFNARVWAKGVLDQVKNQPKPETPEERYLRIKELIRINKGKIWM